MNAEQLTQNLVWVLNATNFQYANGQPVLGRVAVSVNEPTFGLLDQIAPSVLIRPARFAAHPEHPADIEAEVRWTATLFVLNATDQAGGAAVVGGNRPSGGANTSLGRGILEIEPLTSNIWPPGGSKRPEVTFQISACRWPMTTLQELFTGNMALRELL